MIPMRPGETLLNLNIEYRDALDAQELLPPGYVSKARDVSEIAADYEEAVIALVTSHLASRESHP